MCRVQVMSGHDFLIVVGFESGLVTAHSDRKSHLYLNGITTSLEHNQSSMIVAININSE